MSWLIGSRSGFTILVGLVMLFVGSGCGHQEQVQTLSANWAGYCAYGGAFRNVTATWVQPSVRPSWRKTEASFWVGLDGHHSDTVEQIGTEDRTDGHFAEYAAWYEMWPRPQQRIPMTVNPGDAMTGTVTSDGRGEFTLKLTDNSTGASFATTRRSPAGRCASAEICAEAPLRAPWRLARFGLVRFSRCAVNGQSLVSFNWQRTDVVAPDKAWRLATSPLGPDREIFEVVRR